MNFVYIAYDKDNNGFLFADYSEAKRFRRKYHLRLRAFVSAKYRRVRKPGERGYKTVIAALSRQTSKTEKIFNVGKLDVAAQTAKTIVEKRKRRALWLAPIGAIAVLVMAWLNSIDWQMVADERAASSFAPSSEIAEIASELGLTKRGKAIFYANHPQLQTSNVFNEFCGNDGEKIATQGCHYRDGENREHIDIYHTGMDEISENGLNYSFADSRKITALHEMLHAVYDRLGSYKQTDVCSSLRSLTNSIEGLQDELAIYSDDQYCSEAFARFGSEYAVAFNTNYYQSADVWAKLSYDEQRTARYLIALYRKYFDCDKTDIAAAYWQNKNQLAAFEATLDYYKNSLNQEATNINYLISDYYAYSTRRKLNSLNAKISDYNRSVEYYNNLLKTYKKVNTIMDSKKHAVSYL